MSKYNNLYYINRCRLCLFNGDGLIDVLSASALDAEINWYENLSIVSVELIANEIPIEFILSQNYPNLAESGDSPESDDHTILSQKLNIVFLKHPLFS